MAVSAGYIDVIRALLEVEPPPTVLDSRARKIIAELMRKSGYEDIAVELENLKLVNKGKDEL